MPNSPIIGQNIPAVQDTFAGFDILPNQLTPHGFCLFWEPKLIVLFVASNLLIAGAYFTIPAQLAIMQRRGLTDMRPWKLWLFVVFIFSCGVSHLLNIVTIWLPWYYIQAAVDVWTGIASYFTACVLTLALREFKRHPQAALQDKYDG